MTEERHLWTKSNYRREKDSKQQKNIFQHTHNQNKGAGEKGEGFIFYFVTPG